MKVLNEQDKKIFDKTTFMHNCVEWVRFYVEGSTSKESLLQALTNLEKHCGDIRQLLNKEQTAKVCDATKDDSSNTA